MTEFTPLQHAFWAADAARRAMYRERDEAITAAKEPHLNAAYQAAEAVYEQYKDRIRHAEDAQEAARQARDADLIERAQSMTFGVFPVGTLIEHTSRYTGVHERGIVEVWTVDSQSPNNRSYGLPNNGDIVVRLFRKDGTPGKKFYRAGGWRTPDPSEWKVVPA